MPRVFRLKKLQFLEAEGFNGQFLRGLLVKTLRGDKKCFKITFPDNITTKTLAKKFFRLAQQLREL